MIIEFKTGYLGARLRSSTLLGCFTGCNICGIVLFIVTTFILISGMRHLDGTFNVAFFTPPNQNSFLTRTTKKQNGSKLASAV